VVLVNQSGTEDGLLDLTAACRLPVLQDTSDARVFESYGASKWYLYFIRAPGELDRLYYHLDLTGDERERFISEVEAMLGGEE
jgi:hypothetical protein